MPFRKKDEVFGAISLLHFRKAAEIDRVASEHVAFAGRSMVELSCELYSCVLTVKFILECFRVDIQVPLYKEKGNCVLDLNKYWDFT